MTTIRTDAEVFRAASPFDEAPARAERSAGTPRWVRMIGLAILAVIGLTLGAIVGVLIVVGSGLVGLC